MKKLKFKKPKMILLFAFRYALEKQNNYVSEIVSDEIIQNWEYLNIHLKEQIKIEIESSFNINIQYIWNKILKLPEDKETFPITKKLEEWPQIVQERACHESFKPKYVTAIESVNTKQGEFVKFEIDIPKKYQHLFVNCSKAMFYCKIDKSNL